MSSKLDVMAVHIWKSYLFEVHFTIYDAVGSKSCLMLTWVLLWLLCKQKRSKSSCHFIYVIPAYRNKACTIMHYWEINLPPTSKSYLCKDWFVMFEKMFSHYICQMTKTQQYSILPHMFQQMFLPHLTTDCLLHSTLI